MFRKLVLLFCFQIILVQYTYGQFIGAPCNSAANALAWEAAAATPFASAAAWNTGPYTTGAPLAPWTGSIASSPCVGTEWTSGYSPASFAASNGGGLSVTSFSPIAPTGITMTSENAYEGPLAVSGSIPFLGAVALEGALPTAGAGAVNYGCGNGNVAMLSEDIAPIGYNALASAASAYGYGPGYSAELGYGSPLAYETGLLEPAYNLYGNRVYGCGAV